MKISIKKISIKNFLSVGNKWLTIKFISGLYRVTGDNLDNNTKNGVGKSTIFIDSLMYGFFGKPVRKISVTDIPNTINNKKSCEVKLIFNIENKCYMIHRGISPGFLKLYENYNNGDENNNDIIETQESTKKLTQKRIDDIIKSNFNTFSHMLIMSNSYTSPFLDLDNKKKKEIIENILGVSIFGDMEKIANKQLLELKSDYKVELKEYDIKKTHLKNVIDTFDKLLEKSKNFNDIKNNKLNILKIKLKDVILNINISKKQIENTFEIDKNIKILKKYVNKNTKKYNIIHTNIQILLTNLSNEKQNKDKLNDNTCPVCQTKTNSTCIQTYIQKLQEKITSLTNEIKLNKQEKIKLNNKIEYFEKKINELVEKKIVIDQASNKLNLLLNKKENLINQVYEVKNEKNEFSDLLNKKEINLEKCNLNKLETNIKNINVEKLTYAYIKQLLSNEGIKHYIIKKIIKFWNNKVNFYLTKLNAEFNITFDEKLNAIIKSRNRDELQYHSFSGGEKARIDVAILLSIIDISKLQNSIDLNVMVIDELLDGGLDNTGREDVINLFSDMVHKLNKSIYVISHNDNLPLHLFTNEINLIKENGLTKIQNLP